jgi:hypothetical protein
MLYLILTSLLFCAPAEDVDLLTAVPVDAHIVVNVESVGDLRKAFGESAWGQALLDSEMTALADALMKIFDEAEEMDEEIAELMPTRLWTTVSGGITLFAGLEGKKQGGVTVLIEPGEDRDAFDEYLISFRNFILKQESTVDSLDLYGDEEFLVITQEEEGDDTPGLVLCDTGDVVILSIHSFADSAVETVEGIVDVLRGEGAGECLLDSELFIDARETEGGAGMVEVYANAASLIAMGLEIAREMDEGEDDPEMEKILELLGVDDISSVYMKADIGAKETVDQSLFIGIEGDGAIRSFLECADGPLPREFLKLCPAESVSASASFFDINGLYIKILDLVNAIDESALEGYRGMYDTMVKEQFGIDPEKEILALLDGRIVSFSIEIPEDEFIDTGLGMANTGGVLAIGLKDAVAFQNNLEKMLRVFGLYVSIKKEEFQGHTICSIAAPGMPARVSWVFGSDLVAFGFFPTPMRSFIRLMTHEDQPNLVAREEFASMIELAGDAGAMQIADTGRMLKGLIDIFDQTFSQMLQAGLGSEANGEIAELLNLPLPSEEMIDKYFKGVAASFLTIDEKGVHVRYVGR